MNVRFYHARIATMQTDCSIIEGELWVTNNRISYVGAKKESQMLWDREIDCKGNLLMPGFKNAHTHSAMTFLRSFADDLPLQDWLNEQVFPMEAKLTPDDIYHLSKLAILEYLTSGMTSNFDMYITPDTIVQASIDTGFRTVLCGGVSNFLHTVTQVEDWYKKYNNYHELISFQLGFHAEYTIDRPKLMDLAALAKQLKAPVYTHNSETKTEVDACLSRNHMTPTAYFDSLGIYDFGGGGYHCVHMTDEDLAIMKNKRVSVVTNPGSNTKLASGIARIEDMLSRGINIAIGTDGPASNNCLDMFREMFLVTGLAKLKNKDASAVDANEVLKMATINGANAMCLSDCDCLAEGKLADLIMIDLHQPNMQPINSITKNIVYSGSKTNVKLTMINGRILYENGEFFVGEDPEAIYAKANEIINRMR
ncbi:amidohydrolase [Lachnoclostridium phytofermentans]|uniref:amidohydrolase n=1 Tax=Lachnoclostridium phytofermentans TaxID=66219 RepID=UPI00049580BA|nr:amidohydrolase [Lachnoclostridium phytofermentans]